MKSVWTRTLALVCLLCLLMPLLLACSPDEGEELPENMQHATVAGSDYRLYLPIGWNTLCSIGISGGYASRQNMVMIYVKSYDNPDALSAEAYLETVYLATLAAAFPEESAFSSTEPAAAKLGGVDAISITYTGTRELVTYQGIETLCVKGDRVYVFSYCARTDVYEGYLDVRTEVLNSFTFSDTPFVPSTSVNTVDPDAEAPAGMQLASNDDVAYRFYVPASWVLDPNMVTSSAYVSESDRTNVNVTSFSPEKNYASAADYWVEHLAELSTFMQLDMDTVRYTDTSLDGVAASTCEYTAVVSGTTLCFAQTIAAKDGILYTVTMTALPESYDTHTAAYQSILEQFRFR